MKRSTIHIRRGATIIELLVVIGIMGILFSIVFPVFLNARAAGGQVKSLAQAQSIATLLTAHANSNQDTYLAIRAHTNYSASMVPGEGGAVFQDEAIARWMSRHWWPNALNELGFITLHDVWRQFLSPGSDAGESYRFPSYLYSNSFVAAPHLWTESFNGSTDALRDVRTSEVVHPSRKVLVWDGAISYFPGGQNPELALRPMAFADGHGEARRLIDAAAAVANGLNPAEWAHQKLHNTPSGVQGLDFTTPSQ